MSKPLTDLVIKQDVEDAVENEHTYQGEGYIEDEEIQQTGQHKVVVPRFIHELLI